MIVLDAIPSRIIIGIPGWSLGLAIGLALSMIAGEITFAIVKFQTPFFVYTTITNVVAGFVYGCVAAGVGGGVMMRILKGGNVGINQI